MEASLTEYCVGQIVPFAFPFSPRGFVQCDGASLPVSQNQALYSLIYNTYGGDSTNFKVPDLRGTTPVMEDWSNQDYQPGKTGGSEGVTLTLAQMPVHRHTAYGVDVVATKSNNPAGKDRAYADTTGFNLYGPLTGNPMPAVVPLNAGTIGVTGGSAAHNNMQPFAVVNFCIVVSGYYPQRP